MNVFFAAASAGGTPVAVLPAARVLLGRDSLNVFLAAASAGATPVVALPAPRVLLGRDSLNVFFAEDSPACASLAVALPAAGAGAGDCAKPEADRTRTIPAITLRAVAIGASIAGRPDQPRGPL